MSDVILTLILAALIGGAFILLQKKPEDDRHHRSRRSRHSDSDSDSDSSSSNRSRSKRDQKELNELRQNVHILLQQQQQHQHQTHFSASPAFGRSPAFSALDSTPSSVSSPVPSSAPSSSSSSDSSSHPSHHLSASRYSSSSLAPSSNPATEVPVAIFKEMSELQNSIKTLERKNRELNRQLTLNELSNVVDVERKYNITTPGAAPNIKLTASEIETIRGIFNMFDTHGIGQISTSELKALHAKLGEPLTEEEAAAATAELDQDGSGIINFNKFIYWWYENHKGGKKSSAYSNRFKLVHAKLADDHFNVEKVVTQDSGTPFTLEYRLNFYYKQPNASLKPISPWHDVPLYRLGSGSDGQIYNMICEIPKWTRAKFECSTGEPFNPIKQDTQHGKLRYYKHGDMMFNYGFIPQTWEDPAYVPDDTKCPGDNDPIDVLEIGARQLNVGAIAAVKVLGVLALIDDGETDWKIIAIQISDALAHLINDIDDVETHLPGTIKAIREYFRDYKSFSGKINSYALRAQAMPKHYAVKVIEDTHEHWKSLHLVRKENTVTKGGASLAAAAAAPAATPSVDIPNDAPALPAVSPTEKKN